MRASHGVVRLMNFGIARPLTDGNTPAITGPGNTMGTPEYMSSEQGAYRDSQQKAGE